MEGAAAAPDRLFCAMVIRQFLIQRNCKSRKYYGFNHLPPKRAIGSLQYRWGFVSKM